jgi:4-alpha-glucanotransferase
MPFYVAHDSVDVWANKNLFYIDEKGNLTLVAGVPPDYFSETGQLWGNPIYKWNSKKKELYKWWMARFKHWFKYLDLLRLDHFRGFEAYWEVPATAKTAIKGKWKKGPGEDFFKSIIKEIGSLNIIAEDLGIITKGVIELKKKFNFPGMKIFQFGFDGKFSAKNTNLPHNYEVNSVVYSGTHDNQTIDGWYNDLPKENKIIVDKYLKRSNKDIFTDVLRSCHKSKSIYAIYPFQDILRLNDSSIMNRPSTESNNWEWRFTKNQVKEKFLKELKDLTLQNSRG